MKQNSNKVTFRQAFKAESDRTKRYEEAKEGLQSLDDIYKGIYKTLHEKHPGVSESRIREMAKAEIEKVEAEHRAIIEAAINDEDQITRQN